MDLLLKDAPVGDYSLAACALEAIKKDNERLDLVLALQRYLIRSISRCERRMRRLRQARSRIKRKKSSERHTRERSHLLKHLITRLDGRVKELQQQIFLWRCFGDGIAFIYQSKYALKHLLYDRDYMQKQGPGFISGKKGFRKEYKLLCLGIRMKVPVVMSDLTNVIRHGDLCALAGPDPLPIEIKSSDNGNARSSRQISDLYEIAKFYANDGANNFRGAPSTIRVALRHDEVNHLTEINSCIKDALNSGVSVRSPEEGLTYIVFTREVADSGGAELWPQLATKIGPGKICTFLTPDPNWLPLYPFTLSLSSENLIPFIERRLEVAILVDAAVLKRKFADLGVHAIFIMDGRSALQICPDPNDLMKGVLRVSEQLFARISCEFQSLNWFIREQASAFNETTRLTELASNFPGEPWEIPVEWQGATCQFANFIAPPVSGDG